jgi:hypothetical protein
VPLIGQRLLSNLILVCFSCLSDLFVKCPSCTSNFGSQALGTFHVFAKGLKWQAGSLAGRYNDRNNNGVGSVFNFFHNEEEVSFPDRLFPHMNFLWQIKVADSDFPFGLTQCWQMRARRCG